MFNEDQPIGIKRRAGARTIRVKDIKIEASSPRSIPDSKVFTYYFPIINMHV